ncbi:MAG TPA: hypothetical protein VK254_00595 [Candidatus Bathyarchaeia archaeon]|nr:hypothetical protein [Candidatus Bathyarchaeia archaeon]
MNLHDYIEKLRAKPTREKERIAVIGTVVGFFIFLGIWMLSFKEMNKSAEPQVDQASASLNDLKNNFQDGKDSIQNMMQQLPDQASPATPTDNSEENTLPASNDSLQNPADNTGNNDQNKYNVPALP